MATFHLQIVDLDGLVFDGQAQQVSCRTIHGDLAILARHINYVTDIAVGKAEVIFEAGSRREAACVGGMLSMMDGECRLISNTWEWVEEIDLERARKAKEKALARLENPELKEKTRAAAQLKLKRAELRISLAEKK